jgi:enoyl-CoA hydratase/carnithine racemase
MTATAELEVSDEGHVRWIAINRPETKNGLTEDLNRRMIAALDEAQTRAETRCVVLTGRGGSFSSGLDFRAAMQAGPMGIDDAERRMREAFHGLIRAVRRVEKPVVALVDGAAAGFGCDLALACDVRIGTERTRLGGLMPDGGGTFTLPRLVGVAKALELMFTGDLVDADESLKLGLISRKVDSAKAIEETRAFADKLAKGPPLVYAAVKRSVYAGLDSTFDEALEREVKGQMALLKSKDFFEGVAAFFQKRDPNFVGE